MARLQADLTLKFFFDRDIVTVPVPPHFPRSESGWRPPALPPPPLLYYVNH
jgi:hypothetical protein